MEASIRLICLAALCAPAFAQPVLNVSPVAKYPTGSTTLGGSGFGAGEAVEIYFDTTDLALAAANETGAFSGLPLTVPASAAPGTHWITGVGRRTGAAAQTRFIVQTDWPEFHGGAAHQGNNFVENVLNVSNVAGLELRWTAATIDEIYASPVVVNGIVYIASGNKELYAFNSETGSPLWTAGDGGLGVVEATPAVMDGVVYDAMTSFCAFNAASGESIWKASIGSSDSAAVVSDGIVYVGSGTVLVGPAKGNLYALNAATGQILWTADTQQIFSSPAVANGVVYAATYKHGLMAFDAATGKQLWQATGGPSSSSPAVANGVVYMGSGSGKVYAFNAASGEQLWSAATRGKVDSSPAVANGVVFIGSEDHNLYAFQAATGQQLWSAATGGPIESSPMVANGVVYVGSDDYKVYAFDAATGQQLWSAATGYVVSSAPAVVNGLLYVGSQDGSLYVYGLPHPAEPPARPEPRTLRPPES